MWDITRLTKEDAQEWTESLGQVIGGSWRQIAWAKRLGVPKALGMITEQWVNQALGGYVKMSIPERREAVKELAAEGCSTRDIEGILGVGHGIVIRDAGPNGPAATPNGAEIDENSAATPCRRSTTPPSRLRRSALTGRRSSSSRLRKKSALQ